jgi:hypothetical protein
MAPAATLVLMKSRLEIRIMKMTSAGLPKGGKTSWPHSTTVPEKYV